MITYQSKKLWQRSWFAALIGGLAVGGGVWWWQAHQDAEHANDTVAGSASASSAAGSGVVPTPRSTAFAPSPPLTDPTKVPTVLADGRPSDFSPEDWSALKAAMSNQPKGEMERVVAYLRFQRNFERWQALADSRDAPQRQALAQSLLDQVPDRMSKGEVTMGEALLLSTALLADIEPDEQVRQQRLVDLRSKLDGVAPQPDADQVARDAERQREFKRRESAIVAAWQAKPEGNRDQAALERDLETARRAVYGNPKP